MAPQSQPEYQPESQAESQPESQADSPADSPAQPRRERTARALRQAAREAFADLGWGATRVEDIVQRAGVSHGTFYVYYPNKLAVLSDLARAIQAEAGALASAAWEAEDVRGALERIIGGFLDLYERDAPILRAWLDASRDEPDLAGLYLESRALFVSRVADNLAVTLEFSERADAPPTDTIASALVSMVERFAYCWLVLGEPHERQDAVNALVLVWGAALNALAGFDVVEA